MNVTDETRQKKQPSIYIITGGHGFTGNFIVQAVLAQFPKSRIHVTLKADLHTVPELEEAVHEAIDSDAIIVHTLVNRETRESLRRICHERNCRAIDLMGDLINMISEDLNETPLNQPGLFRKANTEYFDRIEAIDFAIKNDDGLKIEYLQNSDIVLTGVSRTGKTPLSMYLAMLGWKVSNVPIIIGFEPPQKLFDIDNRRVFGLRISPAQLLAHRKKRISDYGKLTKTDYINPQKIREELDYAESVFKKGDFTVIDVSNKAIESAANEILKDLSSRYDKSQRKLQPPRINDPGEIHA